MAKVTSKNKVKKIINKKAKQAVGKKTHVAIVLDRSGSMSSIHKQTVDGLNQQFEAFRKNATAAGETDISLIQFDTVIETVFDGIKPENLKEFAMSDFQPRGGTAMYDGIWNAINHLKTKDITDDTAYLICVISDGEENASTEIKQEVLAAEIKKLQDQGNWTFQYLLSNVDINVVRQTLNAQAGNIAYYNSTSAGSTMAYAANATSTVNYMTMRGVTLGSSMSGSYTAYTPEVKARLVNTK
jgi:uncharacterized protein YegL